MKERFDFSSLRQRLTTSQGPDYWRSLEELAKTEEFLEFLQREFPSQASEFADPVGRRRFLKLMAASLALAGVSACTRQPAEAIVPYVQAPEEVIPGKPLYFATAMPWSGSAEGLLVESHMGRPTKIEGNPRHPESLGATSAFAQASILDLYDPDRSQVVSYSGDISTWGNFISALAPQLEKQRLEKGAGLRILTETVTSPTLFSQLEKVLNVFPLAKWHQYEPVSRDNIRRGTQQAFGKVLNPIFRVEKADVILSLEADFLAAGPGTLRYAREFARRRKLETGAPDMNRLYVVESSPSNTGAVADHRLALPSTQIERLARSLAAALGIGEASSALPSAREQKWVKAVAADLKNHQGAALVIAGEQQPPAVHVLAAAMNQALGSFGKTLLHTAPVEASPVDHRESLQELVSDMQGGRVTLLLILGGNPVYCAPADIDFRDSIARVPFRVHLGMYFDETSEQCHWHIPDAHYLEAWGDTRAFDGTITIMQPLIAPLYGGKSSYELLSAVLGQADRSGHKIIQDYWRSQKPSPDFETFWRTSLHDGFVTGSAFPAQDVQFISSSLVAVSEPGRDLSLEIVFRPDPTIFDGRFVNNAWLQELPKPLTKLTWDNAVFVSPRLAEELSLGNQDVVELILKGRTLRGPVSILPGQPPDSIAVHLGYGRRRVGRIGSRRGFNAYQLRTSDAPWFSAGIQIKKTGEKSSLAATQNHHLIEGRNMLRTGTLAEYEHHPEFVHEMGHEPPSELSLYPEYPYEGYAWGMAIDLSSCIGCNACMVACQSENNVPVVGKEQVLRSREMHWLRVDSYFKGSLDDPETYFQPVPCMHCEKAPCEVVCPVGATVHSSEGLNEMVYNRCVGTRYCSNNCPYKVRRFNFLQFSNWDTPSLKLLNNPDVTVRTRGVMEKCTYCVQRINTARIQAKREDRDLRDGEVVTACQAVCPTEAIVFGDINDPESRVSLLKKQPRNYHMLAELNTKPRTSYLAGVRNPNPELENA
ncbi:MAG: TAT-variant-translocated molybdopterin oxidoreductase [Acidobacteria bacterium]|nr:TAT-variant-translocated molybdopterin oxidoreductase [Acidobacteriota bacterium]